MIEGYVHHRFQPHVLFSAFGVEQYEAFSTVQVEYFGKSRGWLMQKVNGNKVNGKIASFTDEERRQFREALQDLSEKMTAVAMTL